MGIKQCFFFCDLSLLHNSRYFRIWGSFCLQYIWEFALGFVLAEYFYHGRSWRIKKYWLLLLAVAGIGLQACFAMLSDVLKLFNDVPALIGYTSLALLFSNIPLIKKLCIQLSAFSYEYFLIHVLIFTTVFHLVKPQGLLMNCIYFFYSLLIQSIFFRFLTTI